MKSWSRKRPKRSQPIARSTYSLHFSCSSSITYLRTCKNRLQRYFNKSYLSRLKIERKKFKKFWLSSLSATSIMTLWVSFSELTDLFWLHLFNLPTKPSLFQLTINLARMRLRLLWLDWLGYFWDLRSTFNFHLKTS